MVVCVALKKLRLKNAAACEVLPTVLRIVLIHKWQLDFRGVSESCDPDCVASDLGVASRRVVRLTTSS